MSDPRAILTVQVPMRTISEANVREHWAKKAGRAKSQRSTMMLSLRSAGFVSGVALDTFHHTVRLVRVAPRRLDTDNLARALKACRDGVADWLRIDDADPRVTWEVSQERGKAREYAVRVEVIPHAKG